MREEGYDNPVARRESTRTVTSETESGDIGATFQKRSKASRYPSPSVSSVVARVRTESEETVRDTPLVEVSTSSELPQIPSVEQSSTTAENEYVPADTPEVRYFATATPSQSPGKSNEKPVESTFTFVIEAQSESEVEIERGTRPEGKPLTVIRCVLVLVHVGVMNARTKSSLPLEARATFLE